MIIRVARHGQPTLNDLPPGANHEFPPKDYALSVLGVEQAHCLGRFLRDDGFHGRIISSPLLRTVETADAVAEECGLRFYLEPRLQEMRYYTTPYEGQPFEVLRREFPRIADDASLPWPWMVDNPDEQIEQVRMRVNEFVDELLANPPADDVLLVGHGASIQSLKWNFFERIGYEGEGRHNWNCSLSKFEIEPDGACKVIDVARYDFMPDEIVTSNARKLGEPEA